MKRVAGETESTVSSSSTLNSGFPSVALAVLERYLEDEDLAALARACRGHMDLFYHRAAYFFQWGCAIESTDDYNNRVLASRSALLQKQLAKIWWLERPGGSDRSGLARPTGHDPRRIPPPCAISIRRVQSRRPPYACTVCATVQVSAQRLPVRYR